MKTVSTGELATRVAQEIHAPEEQARAVLDRAIEVMKKELQRGNRVELPNLLSVQVKLGQPVAAKSSADSSISLPAARLVQLDMDEAFRKELEGTSLYEILLVVPKQNFFTGVMAARLTSPRSEVTVVEQEEAAIQRIREKKPDLVVLDMGLQEPSRVCEAIKKNKGTSLISVISIFGEDETIANVKGLQVVSDESIVEPFELSDLVRLAESELSRFAEERNYFDQQMHFKLQTSEELVERANELIAELLDDSGIGSEAKEAYTIAIREAIDNGCRHGNKNNENRLMDIQYFLDREKVTVSVTDEGDGFDTEVYLSRGVGSDAVEAARQRTQEGGAGGLGIMLMLKCVDKLEYNYAGNKITLSKYIFKQ